MELKSKFKVSAVFLSIALPSSVSFAYYQTPCSFCGYTLGLGIGATTFMADATSDVSVSSVTPSFVLPEVAMLAPPVAGINSFTTNGNSKVYEYDPMARLFIGYGYVFQNYTYLGAELGVNFFGSNDASLHHGATKNTDVTQTNIGTFVGEAILNQSLNTNTKVTRNSVEPTLDIKLGWLMTPTALAYFKGGINYNNLKIKTNTSYQADGSASSIFGDQNFPINATAATSWTASHKSNSLNWRAGAGMEVMLTPELGVGAEYVYTFYRTLKTGSSSNGADVACDSTEGCQIVSSNINNSARVHLNDQEIVAQLLYHFG